MKKNFLLLLLLYTLLPWLPLAAQDASDVPPRPSPPRLVNDLAGMLQPEEVASLEQKLVSYNDTTSTQIAVVNVKSIGPYDISAFAYRLAETWGIGQQGKNNGILILTALQERKVYIATGYGMEAILPDAIAKRITEYTLKPNYKNGNYYQGLDEATNLIINVASGQYQADPQQGEGGDSSLFFWLIIGALALVILFNLRKRGGGGRGGRGMRTLGGPFFPPVLFGDFSSGRGPFGGGGFGGGGGGGFGGFGGGSFGGGGAGSDW
ncbi:MAG: TPM domain-containing protein [Adhaeribacter sp.]